MYKNAIDISQIDLIDMPQDCMHVIHSFLSTIAAEVKQLHMYVYTFYLPSTCDLLFVYSFANVHMCKTTNVGVNQLATYVHRYFTLLFLRSVRFL